MKRPEYVAVVTGIYRRLLDERRLPHGVRSPPRWSRPSPAAALRTAIGWARKGKAMFGTRPENVPEPKELFARARETYENGKENRKIPVNLRLTVLPGRRTGAAERRVRRPERRDHSLGHGRCAGGQPGTGR